MAFKFLTIFIACFFLCNYDCEAKPRRAIKAKSPKPHGIYLIYKTETSFKKLDAVHKKLNTRVIFRDNKTGIDAVLPLLSTLTTNSKYLLSLCQRYKQNAFILGCNNNYKLKRRREVKQQSHSGQSQRYSASTDLRSCDISTPKKKPDFLPKGLDADWHIKYTGIDLGSQAFKKYQRRNPTLKKTKIVIAEPAVQNGSHAIPVLKLIEQCSNHAEIAIAPIRHPLTSNLVSFLMALRDSEVDTVNFSMTIGYDDEVVLREFRRISKDIIPVVAAGNNHPYDLDKNERRAPTILVGSASPFGGASHFSQVGWKENGDDFEWLVDIAAPSDEVLAVYIKEQKKYVPFGGTSGASPIVQGVVADLIALLPGITLDEATKLLIKTALPIYGEQGMVNGYKAIRAAIRLRDKGGAEGWRRHLDEKEIYDFNTEAEATLKEVTPEIKDLLSRKKQNGGKLNQMDCTRYRNALDKLREAFFLTNLLDFEPTEKDSAEEKAFKEKATELYEGARKYMIEIYDEAGLDIYATYYKNHDMEFYKKNLRERIASGKTPIGFAKSAVRAAGLLAYGEPKPGDELISLALKAEREPVREMALYALNSFPNDPIKYFNLVLQKPGDTLGDAMGTASSIYDKMKILNFYRDKIRSTEKNSPQETMLIRAQFINAIHRAEMGESIDQEAYVLGKLLARKITKASDTKNMGDVAEALGTLKSKKSLPILAWAWNKDDNKKYPEYRAKLLSGLSYLGKAGQPFVLQVLKNPDKEKDAVLKAAVRGLWYTEDRDVSHYAHAFSIANKLKDPVLDNELMDMAYMISEENENLSAWGQPAIDFINRWKKTVPENELIQTAVITARIFYKIKFGKSGN